MAVKISKFLVRLVGITPIMFDRYAGSNEEQLPWRDKVYLSSIDKKSLILPAKNLSSFLSAQNTASAPQRVMGKKWKSVAAAALSYVTISPVEIPFLRKGEPLNLENSGIFEDKSVARIKKGQLTIPNPKSRPVLPMDWEIAFEISLFDNKDLTDNILRQLFDVGGIAIGMGTFRGVYGKFIVDKWEQIA
jgi:hypothetical protein